MVALVIVPRLQKKEASRVSMHASLYENKQTNIYIQTLTASLTANRLTEAILTLSNF